MLRSAVRESIKQVPSLGVLAIVVFMFLSALERNNSFIEGLAASCHSTHNRSSNVIEANTKQNGRVEILLDQTLKVLARVSQ